MKRIISLLAVMAIMAALVAASAMPAFALSGGVANDDKNNTTSPGTGAGNNLQSPNQALSNADENCLKQSLTLRYPAQCESEIVPLPE